MAPVETALHVLNPEIDGLAEIDFVAVHGLNFKNHEDHAWATWTRGDKLWPRDFLPGSLSRPARIMLFEYNSSPAYGAAAMDLVDHAKNLLLWLKMRRKDAPRRPLVFICHSLGGLLVKEALIEAHLSSEYEPIKEATCLINFFATPHRGGRNASFGDIIIKISKLGPSPNDLIEKLKAKSLSSTEKLKQFSNLHSKYRFVSFVETQPHGRLEGIIVSKDSAVLGLPVPNETVVMMNSSNHSSICKFASSDSPECKLVLETIKASLNDALLVRGLDTQHGCQQRISDIPEQDKDCLKALYKITGEYDNQRGQIDLQVAGTCTWVLKHRSYLRWRSADGPSLLWITGNPGCGKSVTAGFLVDELVSGCPQAIILPFFFSGGDEQRKKSHQAVCALLHRLFTTKPDLIRYARDSFAAKGEDFALSTEQLWQILRDASEDKQAKSQAKSQPRPQEIICIIDALDECEETNKSRTVLIQQLMSTFLEAMPKTLSARLKVVVTSRPLPEIERFNSINEIRLRSENEPWLVSKDINRFIDHKVTELRQHLTLDVCDMVAEKLRRDADGTFLWISLVLESIVEQPSRKKSAVLNALNRTPSTLDALYESALSAQNETSRKLLQCILAANRPLMLSEINVVLGLENEKVKTLEDLGNELELNIERTIKMLGGFFIRVIASRVHLVHQTARDFLLQRISSNPGHLLDRSPALPQCNLILASRCIRFLLLDDWPSLAEDFVIPDDYGGTCNMHIQLPPEYHDFYYYAAGNWFLHVQGGEINPKQCFEPTDDKIRHIQSSIRKLCDRKQIFLHSWWEAYMYPMAHVRSNFLHHAASRGEPFVLQCLLASGSFCINDKDLFGYDVLCAAAADSRNETVGWILETHGEESLQYEIALVMFLHHADVHGIEMLLNKKQNIDLNTRQKFYGSDGTFTMSPLEAASGSCPTSVLERLERAGADIFDPKALCRAIDTERVDNLRWLLDRCMRAKTEGVPQTMEATLTPAAEFAAQVGRLHMLDVIQKYENNLPISYNFTAGLAAATQRGDTENLSRLLRMGITDSQSCEALHAAGSHPECLEVLLDHISYPATELRKFLRNNCIEYGQGSRTWFGLCFYHDINFRFIMDQKRNDEHIFAKWRLTGKALSRILDNLHEDLPKGRAYHALRCLNTVLRCDNLSDLAARALLAQNFSLVCLAGKVELAVALVGLGASVAQEAPLGMSPLLAAVFSGSFELMDYLIKNGADPDELCYVRDDREYQKVSPESNIDGVSDVELESGRDSLESAMDMPIVLSQDTVDKSWQAVGYAFRERPFLETPISLARQLHKGSLKGLIKDQTVTRNTSTWNLVRRKVVQLEDYKNGVGSELNEILERNPILKELIGRDV